MVNQKIHPNKGGFIDINTDASIIFFKEEALVGVKLIVT